MSRIQPFWKDPEFYFSLAILSFILLVLASCPSLSSKGRLIPLVVAIGTLPLTVLNILACIFPSVRAAVRALKAVELFTGKGDDSRRKEKEEPAFTEMLIVVLWFAGAYLLFLFTGYLPMVFFFSFFFLRFRVRFTWAKSAGMAVLFSVCTWAVFSLVLGLEPFGIRYYY